MTISSKNIVVKTTRKNSKPSGNTINDVFNRLMEKDYESAFGTVHNYLESIGKIEYEELVVSLITISILENDSIYYEPINVLSSLNKKDFSFDVHPYVEYYEETLKKGNIPLAKAILGVLKNSHALDSTTVESFESKLPKSGIETKKLKVDTSFINIDEFYGVEGLQTIIWAIETGISIDEAFARFDATDEQKSLIFLILAQEAYLKSMFKIGDKYMKVVERLPKTSQIKELFRYLTVNKKFLKNREVDSNPYIILPK